MLPATEAVPKELFPIGGRPAIDWILDEAETAGIEEAVIVSSERKPAIEAYVIATRHRSLHRCISSELAPCRGLDVRFVIQREPKGLGDAVLRGWGIVPEEPIAVLLPDELMLGGAELLAAMLEHHDREGRSMVALMQVPLADMTAYGCACLEGPGPHGTMAVTGFIEKPGPIAAPSSYAVCGRYLLNPDVFGVLQKIDTDASGELQLTAALDLAAQEEEILALEVFPRDGRVDVGNWTGWLRANRQTLETNRPEGGVGCSR
jgi:UTP--glucose-1-phosphate uridylyltransferase